MQQQLLVLQDFIRQHVGSGMAAAANAERAGQSMYQVPNSALFSVCMWSIFAFFICCCRLALQEQSRIVPAKKPSQLPC